MKWFALRKSLAKINSSIWWHKEREKERQRERGEDRERINLEMCIHMVETMRQNEYICTYILSIKFNKPSSHSGWLTIDVNWCISTCTQNICTDRFVKSASSAFSQELIAKTFTSQLLFWSVNEPTTTKLISVSNRKIIWTKQDVIELF